MHMRMHVMYMRMHAMHMHMRMPCSVVNFLKIALINPCQMNVKTIIKYIFNLILIYPALSSLTYEIYTTIPSRYFMMSPMDFPLNFKLF